MYYKEQINIAELILVAEPTPDVGMAQIVMLRIFSFCLKGTT